MKIVFSDHALLKIKERKLKKIFIKETIEAPDLIRASHNFREERFKDFGKNWLKVVLVKEHGATVVVTAHWVAKTKKL